MPETVLSRVSGTALRLRFANADRILNRCGHGTVAAVADWVLQAGVPNGCWHLGRYHVGKSASAWRARATSRTCAEVQVSWPDQPRRVAQLPPMEVGKALALRRHDIDLNFPIGIYSSGQLHALVPIVSESVLAQAQPIWSKLDVLFTQLDLTDMHLYCPTSIDSECYTMRVRCRNIFPYGVREESATGTASVALAGALVNWLDQKSVRSSTFEIQITFDQGAGVRRGILKVRWCPRSHSDSGIWLEGSVHRALCGKLLHTPSTYVRARG